MSELTLSEVNAGLEFGTPNPARVARLAQRREAMRRYRAKNPLSTRRCRIVESEFNRLMRRQQGHCALCPTAFESPKQAHVDHNHTTGKIRGLLCPKCNSGLGHFDDDPARLRKAAAYLRRGK